MRPVRSAGAQVFVLARRQVGALLQLRRVSVLSERQSRVGPRWIDGRRGDETIRLPRSHRSGSRHVRRGYRKGRGREVRTLTVTGWEAEPRQISGAGGPEWLARGTGRPEAGGVCVEVPHARSLSDPLVVPALQLGEDEHQGEESDEGGQHPFDPYGQFDHCQFIVHCPHPLLPTIVATVRTLR